MSGKSKGISVVIFALVALFLAVTGVLVGVIVAQRAALNQQPVAQEQEEAPKRPVVANERNVREVVRALDEAEQVPVGSYEAVMNSDWRFADGDSASENAYVENVPENTNDVYFDVQLADTGETIYESPVIPRGSHLNQIKLDKHLEQGTYDAVLIYHLIDENQRTLRTLRMAITITVDS
jgi:hypothetical protein